MRRSGDSTSTARTTKTLVTANGWSAGVEFRTLSVNATCKSGNFASLSEEVNQTGKTIQSSCRSRMMIAPTTVSRETWLAARKALLKKEKAYTRAGDVLAAKRREMS